MRDRVAHMEAIDSQLHGQALHNFLAEDVKLEPLDINLTSIDYTASSVGMPRSAGPSNVAGDNSVLSPSIQQHDYTRLSSPLVQTAYSSNPSPMNKYGNGWQDSYDVLSTDFLTPTYSGFPNVDLQAFGLGTPSSSSFGNYDFQDPLTHGLDHLMLPDDSANLHAQTTHDPFTDPLSFESNTPFPSINPLDFDDPIYYSGNGPGYMVSQQVDQHSQHLPLLELPRNENYMFYQGLDDFPQLPIPQQLPELPMVGRIDTQHNSNLHDYLNLPEPESIMNTTENAELDVRQSCGPSTPQVPKSSTTSSTSDSRKQGAKPLTLKDLAHDDSRFAKVVMAFMSISDEKRRTVTEIAKQVSVLFPEKYGDFEYVKVSLCAK